MASMCIRKFLPLLFKGRQITILLKQLPGIGGEEGTEERNVTSSEPCTTKRCLKQNKIILIFGKDLFFNVYVRLKTKIQLAADEQKEKV